MIDPSPSPLFLGATAAVPFPRAAVRAYLALAGAAGATVTAILLLMSVAANSGTEAERISETRNEGYVPTLVAALTVNLSKPLR